MMRITAKFIAVCLMVMAAVPALAQNQVRKDETVVLGKVLTPKDTTAQRRFTNRLIAPKGEWQAGLSVMYIDFNSSDSDYMLMLQGLNARASMLTLAPQAAYTFRDNHAVGIRLNYTKLGGMLDTATADLLGNLSLSVEDINATSASLGASIFQRTYVGLDSKGRFGIFWDYILGYSRSKTQFATSGAAPTYSMKEKFNLAFSPGLVYFPMNNISVQACISIADLSYSCTTAYEDGVKAGENMGWRAKAGLNLLNLSFGLTIHL